MITVIEQNYEELWSESEMIAPHFWGPHSPHAELLFVVSA